MVLIFTLPVGIDDLKGEIEYLFRVLILTSSPPVNADLLLFTLIEKVGKPFPLREEENSERLKGNSLKERFPLKKVFLFAKSCQKAYIE
ncbi:hypothetical protein L0244_28820 [bacterium]|nr:hypothetical protein [bacterium]